MAILFRSLCVNFAIRTTLTWLVMGTSIISSIVICTGLRPSVRDFVSTYRCMGICLISWRRLEMKTVPHYWPFLKGIHRSPVESLHNRPLMRTLIFLAASLSCWADSRVAGGLRHNDACMTLLYDMGLSQYVSTCLQWGHITGYIKCYISHTLYMKSSLQLVQSLRSHRYYCFLLFTDD